MSNLHPLAGVYAAAITPLKKDGRLDFESIPSLLRFLATRGCHGALFFGTTGEGPSFSPKEREALLRSIRAFRSQAPGFRLLAGTGTPSLAETIELTKLAFDLTYDGVVVLPPYYFSKVTDDGLFAWFSQVIQQAVPPEKHLLGYHIPNTAGIGLSLDLIARLKDAYPTQFAGIKDSSGSAEFAAQLGQRFGRDLAVFSGTDSLFAHALSNHAQGAITAPANLTSPLLRELWELFQEGQDTAAVQKQVTEQRQVLEKYAPHAPTLKALLHKLHDFPEWTVKPPLEELSKELEDAAFREIKDLME
ncbi:MAG: dihydrodipicolinate synthase family protein [Anaerolineales bacterium]|nr:dihydrodipicolinate synthase family protein [Anaerolineales bacterium]